MLGEIVIFPLMDLLGIDKRTETCFDKTWGGIRQFFREKLPQLVQVKESCSLQTCSGKEKGNARAILSTSLCCPEAKGKNTKSNSLTVLSLETGEVQQDRLPVAFITSTSD